MIRDRARLTGVKTLELPDGTELVANHAVVLATGSTPSEPPIDGLAGARHWGFREATSAQSVPASLAVIGAGVVGCELAQAWARLGSTVTLLVRGDRILEPMEPAASALVRAGLEADGITVKMNTSATRVTPRRRRGPPGARRRHRVGGRGTARGHRSQARDPADLGLETVGLADGAPIEVDDTGLVQGADGGSDGWLYACGDVAGRAPLTHQGKYEARVVGDVIAARAAGEPVPGPAVGQARGHRRPRCGAAGGVHRPGGGVGRAHRRTARRGGDRPRTWWRSTSPWGGSSLHADGYTGKAIMIVDRERRVLLGVTFCGPDVAEMIHAATIAVVGEVPVDRLWHAVPAYPTISEVWLRLLEAYGL